MDAKLRLLLADARQAVNNEYMSQTERIDLRDRIDAALRAPAQECDLCAVSKAFHDLAVKERDYERLQVDRLRKQFDDCWSECHDGTEEGCWKSHE